MLTVNHGDRVDELMAGSEMWLDDGCGKLTEMACACLLTAAALRQGDGVRVQRMEASAC